MSRSAWCLVVGAALAAGLGSGCDDRLPPIDDGSIDGGAVDAPRPDAAVDAPRPDAELADGQRPREAAVDAAGDRSSGDGPPPCKLCKYNYACRGGRCVPAVCLDPSLILELQLDQSLVDLVGKALPTSPPAVQYDVADGYPAPSLLRAVTDPGLSYPAPKLSSKSWTISLWMHTSVPTTVVNKDRILLRVVYDSGQAIEVLDHSYADGFPAPWFGARIAPETSPLSIRDQTFDKNIPVNIWTQVALTMEAAPPQAQSPVRVWINGDYMGPGGSLSLGPVPSGTVSQIVVGGHEAPGGDVEALPGRIDEVRVFNRLLSRDELKLLAFDPCH